MTQTAASVRHIPAARVDVAVGLVAAGFVVVQALVTVFGSYGYFIDEFYYIACARHLAFGYVDHPPLAPVVLAATRAVLGDSLLAIRIPAFLLGAVVIWATGLMAREFGGDRWAAITAAIVAAFAPGMLAIGGFFSVNAFEVAAWTLCTWALVRLIRTGDTRLWLLIGLAVGLGFESKHTIVTFVSALGCGLVLTRARRLLWNRHALGAAAIALGLALPNVVWQVVHGYPSLEFYRNAALFKNKPSPPLHTLLDQLQIMGLFTWTVWLTALGWLLFTREGGRWRAIAIAYVVLLALLVISQQSRPDRLLGIYPVLIAAGCAVIARAIRSPGARAGVTALLVLGCLPGVPIVIGVLPPPTLARYVAWLGIETSGERGKASPIPQLLADRTGWEDFVRQIAGIYGSLSPAEKQKALVYAPSYGQAGAIDLLGRPYGLPRAIARQNSYWHWSAAEGVDSDVLIAVDANEADLRSLFRDVRKVGVTSCTYCMSWRNGNPVYLARGSIRPVSSVWARVRYYE